MRIIALALLLAACDGDSQPAPPTQGWEIGPIIDGRNYSKGLTRTTGTFTISPTQQPHYVTKAGRSINSLRFNVSGPLVGVGCGAATVSLYFQVAGDDWSTDGKRWWSGTTTVDHAGDYEITAGSWSSVQSMTQANSPAAFADAKANANRIGFTFGNCEGLGHGATAAEPVTFIIKGVG